MRMCRREELFIMSNVNIFKNQNEKLISSLQKIALMDRSVLTNIDVIRSTLISGSVSQKDIDTIVSIFNNSNIKKFLILDKMDAIVFNSIVVDIENHCYLSKKNAQNFANIILYSFGFGIFLDDNKATVIQRINEKNHKEYFSRYIPCDSADRDMLTMIGGFVSSENESKLSNPEITTAFEQLCDAENAEALYYKGLCYKKGLGTQKDISKAVNCFYRSASYGYSRAAAELGDVYFDLDMNTNAYEEYTRIGAVTLSRDRRKNVRTLTNNKVIVKKSFIFSTIVFVLSIIYMIILMSNQMFSAFKGYLVVCILGLVSCVINEVVSAIYYYKRPYDSISCFTIINSLIVSVITFFSVIM